MRKIAMLFAVLFFSTASVFAQTQVKGKVTDKDGLPVAGASVKLKVPLLVQVPNQMAALTWTYNPEPSSYLHQQVLSPLK